MLWFFCLAACPGPSLVTPLISWARSAGATSACERWGLCVVAWYSPFSWPGNNPHYNTQTLSLVHACTHTLTHTKCLCTQACTRRHTHTHTCSTDLQPSGLQKKVFQPEQGNMWKIERNRSSHFLFQVFSSQGRQHALATRRYSVPLCPLCFCLDVIHWVPTWCSARILSICVIAALVESRCVSVFTGRRRHNLCGLSEFCMFVSICLHPFVRTVRVQQLFLSPSQHYAHFLQYVTPSNMFYCFIVVFRNLDGTFVCVVRVKLRLLMLKRALLLLTQVDVWKVLYEGKHMC